MPARHRRATIRGRRLLVGVLVTGVAIAGGVAWWSNRSPIAIPDDPCSRPPPLRTAAGVTLQPAALEAFRAAERRAGVPIPVVWSYRSCAQQRVACRNICGDATGCPGRCAPPGRSWHQLGAAIDTTEEALRARRVVRALLDTGWCQPLPSSDPGHFSFGGCH